jgi:transposase-like protein
MDAAQPRTRVVRRRCAPKWFPCPHCGKQGKRKARHTRRLTDLAYQQIVILELTVGEYRARCSCCKTFRSQVEGIEPRAEYTNRVRDAVIDRLLDDGMSMERVQQAMQRDFCLDLSDGFLYDCLDWKVRQLDLSDYRQWTLDHFSGTLCIDEIHLGKKTLLLATDPLSDFPVAFALVGSNDHDHMKRFLTNLKNHGFMPRVVVTDGSNLYPALLAEVWPHAQHQLCIFHVLKDINACVFDALRVLRRRLARQGRGPGRRGRRPKAQQRARARRGATKKDQAHYIWKHRHLLVRKAEDLLPREVDHLLQMMAYLPALATLRRFVVEVYQLFDPEQSPHQARCRRAALAKRAEYQAFADLVRALAMLKPKKFAKMIAYLHSPAGQRVRTNNHVERVNRKVRYFEKVRYKWRRRRTIVRFVVLALDRWRQQWQAARQAKTNRKRRKPSGSARPRAA